MTTQHRKQSAQKRSHSPHGLDGLPVDSIVTAWGFGAEPAKVRIIAPQLSDGRYPVALVRDGSVTNKIHPDDIAIVHSVESGAQTCSHSPNGVQ